MDLGLGSFLVFSLGLSFLFVTDKFNRKVRKVFTQGSQSFIQSFASFAVKFSPQIHELFLESSFVNLISQDLCNLCEKSLRTFRLINVQTEY
ncbi:hypothetical protein BC749_10267 [Flavobacterium araucananum]|uniref:Uncharacterized protein n=1 Tax=Flavobacterium araucananum TaxID=946678 RepID=A0A227P9A5_9FLAO|nr:hypothetical protein B0A64_11245 [Flavobacterium araucananum]PWK00505.1 hypothetical protein BC749_10267 [Flavobacterium araucananum]